MLYRGQRIEIISHGGSKVELRGQEKDPNVVIELCLTAIMAVTQNLMQKKDVIGVAELPKDLVKTQ